MTTTPDQEPDYVAPASSDTEADPLGDGDYFDPDLLPGGPDYDQLPALGVEDPLPEEDGA